MRKLFWLTSGIALGLVIAKQIEQNPAAKAIANDVEKAAREFGAAVSEGFKEREAEIEKSSAPKKTAPAAKKTAPARKRAAK
ncbi:MAG: hypothetical protein RLZZ400_543 [Actinomycetota bacterium]|jgi:hypothetical protein